MNRRLMIQVAAPTVLIGLLLMLASLVSAWHVNRLQANLTTILASNHASTRAAQQLEICVRQLRFHCFLYLADPDPSLLRNIEEDDRNFEKWLERAEETAFTAEERVLVREIRDGYGLYRREFERLRRQEEKDGPRHDLRHLAAVDPLRHIIEPCRQYLQVNDQQMEQTATESADVGRRLRLILLLLGVGGPLGGLLSGFGIARGLSRSLHRLVVRVQGAAKQLDRDVADVRLTADGDTRDLDQLLQYVVGRVTEVTERWRRQQRDLLRAQQLAAVGQLAASVAHEVRNPLTSIKMLVEAGLRDPKPRPVTPENLRIIHAEVLRLEQTVQSFLDFARPPALRRGDCDLRGVVGRAVELVRARARQQGVRIDVDCPDQAVGACVDQGQLCTVLVNLFVNALDAMPKGGRLGVQLRPGPAGDVRLVVTDTGAGLAPEVAGRLFTPFTSTKPTGSGLGLSISRRIVEEHGGEIAADNGPAGGACFTVTLPLSVVRGQ